MVYVIKWGLGVIFVKVRLSIKYLIVVLNKEGKGD